MILTKNCSDDQIKNSVMGQACGTCGRRVSYVQGTDKKNLKKRDYLGGLGIDTWIIKTNLKGKIGEGVEWIYLAQSRKMLAGSYERGDEVKCGRVLY